MFLVAKLVNKQDITMGREVCIWNLEVFEDMKKMQRISARKEYASMDRPEICEVGDVIIDTF